MTNGKNEELVTALKTLLDEGVDKEVSVEKQRQFLRLDKCDKYFRGIQYLALNKSPDGAWKYSAVGAPITPSGDQLDDVGYYDYNLDIIKTFGKRYTSVLGQRPFYAMKAVADDPQSEDDRRASRQAEIAKSWLHQKWDVPVQNLNIAHHEWKSGTVWVYTPYAVDGQMFGESQEPVLEDRDVVLEEGGYQCFNCGEKHPELETDELTGVTVCPNCKYPSDVNAFEEPKTVKVPEIVGYETYENGGAAFQIHTGYTVTVPFYSKDPIRLPYLLCEYEEHKGELMKMYPELREYVNDHLDFEYSGDSSGDTSQNAIQTRASAESLEGTKGSVHKNRWTYSRFWLSPAMFEMVDDEDIRKQLTDTYKRGLKMVRIEGKILPDRFEDEAAHEVWTPILPETSDFLYTDPVCWSILGHQDITNDMWNLALETLERGLPAHIVDAGLIDIDALSQRPFLPQEFLETKGQVGASLDSRIKTLPTAKFPEQIPNVIAGVEKAVQDNTGLQPRVYGAANARMTAEQARMDLSQALMVLGMPGIFMTRGWLKSTENAIRQMEKFSPKNMRVVVEGATEMLDFDAMRSGKWHFEPVHQGIPQTFSERRDSLQDLIMNNPQLALKIGVDQPSNLGLIKDYFGLNDLKTPGEDLRQKVLDTIQELLGSAPTQEVMFDGSTMLFPTIPPEEFVDDPMLVSQLVREWLISPPGRKAKAETPDGYENVKAYGMAQQRRVPPMGIGGPGGQGGAPPVTPPQNAPKQQQNGGRMGGSEQAGPQPLSSPEAQGPPPPPPTA